MAKHEQRIFSRYEYSMGEQSTQDLFREIHEMFAPGYDNNGIQVSGVSAAVAVDTHRAILFVYDLEAEAFMKLKFARSKDVKINRYY